MHFSRFVFLWCIFVNIYFVGAFAKCIPSDTGNFLLHTIDFSQLTHYLPHYGPTGLFKPYIKSLFPPSGPTMPIIKLTRPIVCLLPVHSSGVVCLVLLDMRHSCLNEILGPCDLLGCCTERGQSTNPGGSIKTKCQLTH